MIFSPIVTITDAASMRAKSLLSKGPENVIGLRIGLKSRGCSGLSYSIDYAEKPKKFEDIIEHNGVKFLIDPQALMFLIGTEIDYVEEKLQSGFVFRNPNEKGRCGCGESFHV